VVNKVTPNKAHRVHRKNQPSARGAKGEKQPVQIQTYLQHQSLL